MSSWVLEGGKDKVIPLQLEDEVVNSLNTEPAFHMEVSEGE